MTNDPKENVAQWLVAPLTDEVSKSLHRLAASDDVQHVAVMPDVHLAADVCNGTAIATSELIYPQAIGSDIGCGMLAVALNLEASALSTEHAAGQLMAGLYQQIPSIKHPAARCPEKLPAPLADRRLSHAGLDKQKSRDGVHQLGTLGRGNHFVEFQADADQRLWLMLHSGSRGMGQMITEHHLHGTQASSTGHRFLEASTEAGKAYLSDLKWAIEYARQSRLAMAYAIEQLMAKLFQSDVDWSTLIHCHHNHVLRGVYDGKPAWIHRKGALPAADGEPGVIPGSMGTRSYHVTGRGVASSLLSSSHGAGRSMPRSTAMQQISRRQLQQQMDKVWFDQRLIEKLRDEAPAAYKDIGRVMRAQRDLTRIVRELQPALVYKGV